MQGYSTPSLLYDEGLFGRSELNFNDNGGPGGEPTISNSGLLGLSDSLDRLDTASSFGSGNSLPQALGLQGDPMATTAPSQDRISGTLSGSLQNVSAREHHQHSQQQQSSDLLNHGHDHHHSSFGLDDDGSMVMQDMLHHHQIMNTAAALGERSSQPGDQNCNNNNNNNGVTSQWEESLQDLQSLLALHGQQHSQNIMAGVLLPMTLDQQQPGAVAGVHAFINSSNGSNVTRTSDSLGGGYGLEKGHAGGSPSITCGLTFGSNSKISAAAGDSDLLGLFQFPRPSNSSSLQQQLQAPAGPVSAFPSNPGFRKGSGPGGPVNSSCNIPSAAAGGLYSGSSTFGAQNSSSFPYTVPSLVGSNYFNVSPAGGFGNLSNFMNHHAGASPPFTTQRQQKLMRAPSIIDLEHARDHCSEDNSGHVGAAASSSAVAAAAKFSSSLFESAKRGGSEGASLLLSGKAGSEPRGINHFATERQRREYLNEKYQTLRSLVPNPSKADRASIVADAIEYVKELKRTVQELQILVQDKQRETSLKEAHYCSSSSHKRRRSMVDVDSSCNAPESSGGGAIDVGSGTSLGRSFSLNNGKSSTVVVDPLSDSTHLRSSWLQRTSQTTDTHVDVRIVHDEVTIKLTKRRRKQPGGQLLLHVMVTLYELQLDLQHANGANIGEHDVYIFNTKVLEGSSTFASYVVTKLLEAVDRE